MISKRAVGWTVVALFVTACIVVAAVTFVGNATSKKQSSFCAYLSDSVGLYVGNPVTQMGYPIGTVSQIKPQPERARVEFDVDTDRPLPAGVEAVIRSKSLLADRSLELVGNYAAGPKLAGDQCISIDRTATPKSLSEITGSASDFLRALSPEDTDSVASAVNGVDTALKGQGDSMNRLLKHAAGAMTSPDQMVADVGSIITDLAPFSTTTLDNWSTAKDVLAVLPQDLEVASDGLWEGVTTFIGGLGPLVADLYDVQKNYGEDINAILGYASVGLKIAASRSDDIKGLLSSIPSMAGFLRTTSSGTGLQVSPPKVDVRSPDPTTLCRQVNRVRAKSCEVVNDHARLSDLRILDAVLSGGQR